jgi:DNA-binding GntR family transcriptional regulator
MAHRQKARSLVTDVVALDPWQGVYRALRKMILSGELEPGQRLVESQLTARFGTSNGPVRTAVKELERHGLVTVVPRRGAFVRSFTARDVEEILTLWELIWSFAVRRAVPRLSAADRARLAGMVEQMPPQTDREALLEWSIAFHRVMFEVAEHERVLEIFDSLVVQPPTRLLLLVAAGRWPDLHLPDPAPNFYAALDRGDVNAALEISCAWTRELGDFLAAQSTNGFRDLIGEQAGAGAT